MRRFSLTVRQKTITPPEYKLELLVITSNKIRNLLLLRIIEY